MVRCTYEPSPERMRGRSVRTHDHNTTRPPDAVRCFLFLSFLPSLACVPPPPPLLPGMPADLEKDPKVMELTTDYVAKAEAEAAETQR